MRQELKRAVQSITGRTVNVTKIKGLPLSDYCSVVLQSSFTRSVNPVTGESEADNVCRIGCYCILDLLGDLYREVDQTHHHVLLHGNQKLSGGLIRW